MATLPALTETTLDLLCRTLADAATHKEVGILLSQCGIEERGGPWVEAARPEQIEVLERN